MIYTIEEIKTFLRDSKFCQNFYTLEDEQYDFNIIELISDDYKKEKFHSNIIAKLLENNTILKNFLIFIDIDNKEHSKYLNENYEIEVEENFIDIIIKSNNNCIIIENKLNWAKDQNKQLKRYYDHCISNDLNVDKVVYLSPHEDKLPTENSKQNIPENLIKVIYGYNGKGNDLYTKVIKKSFDNFTHTTNKEWIILAEHYLKILKNTGSNNMDEMTNNCYNEIMESNIKYEQIQYIVNLYNNLVHIRINKLVDIFKLQKLSKKVAIKSFKDKNNIEYILKVMLDNNYSIIYIYPEGCPDDEFEKITNNINEWLNNHKLYKLHKNMTMERYYGKYFTKKIYKFPEEETKLYEFIEKLIDCMERDIESICVCSKK